MKFLPLVIWLILAFPAFGLYDWLSVKAGHEKFDKKDEAACAKIYLLFAIVLLFLCWAS